MSHPGGTPHVGTSTGGGLDSTTRSAREPALGAQLGGGRPGGAQTSDAQTGGGAAGGGAAGGDETGGARTWDDESLED